MAGGGFPREVFRLAFHLDGGGDGERGVARAVAAAAPGAAGRNWRRQTTYWDGAGNPLAAAGLTLATHPGAGGGVAQLSRSLDPCRERIWTATRVADPPSVGVFAAAATLPEEIVTAPLVPTARRAARGRTWSLATRSRLSVEFERAMWESGPERYETRLLIVESGARSAGEAVHVAEALAATLALRLAGRPVAGAVLDQLRGIAARAYRLPSPSLDGDGPIAAGFLASGRVAVRQMLANIDGTMAARDPDCVHQFRVGLRRLRTLLSIFRDSLRDDERGAVAGELKWLNGVFAAPREWDVMLSETLAPLVAEATEPTLPQSFVRYAEGRRDEAYARLAADLGAPRLTAILLVLLRWFELGNAPLSATADGRSLADFARRGLDRTRRRMTRHYRRMDRSSTEQWHELRKIAKKARYAAETFATLHDDDEVQPYMRALERLQDSLGRFNDAAVAEQLALSCRDDALRPAMAAMLSGWTARERALQRDAARMRWKKFRKADPFWRGS